MAGSFSVTDQVAAYIQLNIENGSWPLGSKLPSESQLCSTLGVSRTSVRSAIQQFIAIGAVESIHGKGTFVRSDKVGRLNRATPITKEILKDVLNACALLRPQICLYAMQAGDSQLLPDLKKILHQMHNLKPEQHRELFRLIDQFYQRISSTLDNQVLDMVRKQFTSVLNYFPPSENENVLFYGSLYYHNAIVEAFAHQDAERLVHIVSNYYKNMISFYDCRTTRTRPGSDPE